MIKHVHADNRTHDCSDGCSKGVDQNDGIGMLIVMMFWLTILLTTLFVIPSVNGLIY